MVMGGRRSEFHHRPPPAILLRFRHPARACHRLLPRRCLLFLPRLPTRFLTRIDERALISASAVLWSLSPPRIATVPSMGIEVVPAGTGPVIVVVVVKEEEEEEEKP